MNILKTNNYSDKINIMTKGFQWVMANTSNQILDNLSFQAFMNQVGRGDRAAQQALYRFFPQTG